MHVQVDRFPIRTFPDLNPAYVDLVRDGDPATAQVWTLHLRVPGGDLSTLRDLLVGLDEAGMDDWCGGDSFAEWAEPYDGDDCAVHAYLARPCGVDFAVQTARRIISDHLDSRYLDPRNVTLSTAGDWSEQREVWTV